MDELILSQDGSHTVLSKKFGVSYHSKYGAVQETQTVFIDAGLKHKENTGKTTFSILEMGFGTGLNALMTYQQKSPTSTITYHTIEAYPLSKEKYQLLNYPTVLGLESISHSIFIKMHDVSSEETLQFDHFSFTKFLCKIEAFEAPIKYDLVYYDAFAPTSQEELWTPEMMEKIYGMCHPGAVLVTYCAKGSFKRALKSAGFIVEGLDGPIGKREMTRAIKPL